jgi:hypothetical protein
MALAACHPTPPTAWDEGGTALVIPNATLHRHDAQAVRIHSDGRITRDDEVLYFVDRAGRVTDEDYESLALLTPEGQLLGNEDVYWGRVGLRNASPPWTSTAWLRVTPRGTLLVFDAAGEPYHRGEWRGCDGPGLRACTLVSHLLTLAGMRTYPESSVYFGVGVGVWY